MPIFEVKLSVARYYWVYFIIVKVEFAYRLILKRLNIGGPIKRSVSSIDATSLAYSSLAFQQMYFKNTLELNSKKFSDGVHEYSTGIREIHEYSTGTDF